MSVSDLKTLGKLFKEGCISDWNTTEWLCVRVLGPLIQREGEPVGENLSERLGSFRLFVAKAGCARCFC